jgi:hypothetical protein
VRARLVSSMVADCLLPSFRRPVFLLMLDLRCIIGRVAGKLLACGAGTAYW